MRAGEWVVGSRGDVRERRADGEETRQTTGLGSRVSGTIPPCAPAGTRREGREARAGGSEKPGGSGVVRVGGVVVGRTRETWCLGR